jgi:hypothetical protein
MGIQTVSQALSNENGGFSPFGFKNRIINGAMVIDQRNAGASVTPNGTYTLDRWYGDNSQTGKFTVQQNAGAVTPPAGFINYLGVTSSSPGYSLLTTDEFRIGQQIEGLNVADLAWGTASAATVTLTFWVRSSLTGAFGGALGNSANNRSYPFTYTISVANTWEQKTVTIAGDTSGTWLTTNGKGINVQFSLGCGSTYSGTANIWAGAFYIQPTGSTSVVSTSGATFYVTGVQLEKAPQATAFDYRDYGNELRLCQRYYYKIDGTEGLCSVGSGQNISTTESRITVLYPVKMRASPTASISGTLYILNNTGTGITITSLASNYGGSQSAMISFGVASGLTAGSGAVAITNSASSHYFQASAEL